MKYKKTFKTQPLEEQVSGYLMHNKKQSIRKVNKSLNVYCGSKLLYRIKNNLVLDDLKIS